MSSADRINSVETSLTAIDPEFYPAAKHGAAHYDAAVSRSLEQFDEIRPRYEEIERLFPTAFSSGIKQFRRRFPDFKLTIPVTLLHSLGEMDGGTRVYDGHGRLIFGADVIARIHTPDSLLPLFDHELFHVENERHLGNCDVALWCSLWEEGLAVYAASVMNPGADDRQLLLVSPQLIRPVVDAHWREALCDIQSKLSLPADSIEARKYFTGSSSVSFLPPRSGYYIGYKIATRLGQTRTLDALARLPQAQALPLLERELQAMVIQAGGCGAP